MLPQQPAYYPPAPLPAYPHPAAFASNAGPGFARPEGLPVQVGIPVAGHAINPLPPLPSYPPLGHQQPLPNASCTTPRPAIPGQAVMGNIPGPVMGQAVLPYAAPAPNLMNGMHAVAPNHEMIIPGQHVSAPHPPNFYASNTRYHSNPSTPWQGQPASSCPPSQVIYPAPASCLQSNAPPQNFIPALPGVPNQHPHVQASCQGFPHQEHAARCTHSGSFGAPNGCQTHLHVSAANVTAIGVPVMGAPIYKGGTHVIPSTAFPGQQPGQPRQQANSESPAPAEPVPQSSKTFFSLTKYYRGNNPHSFPVAKPETQSCANGGQPLNTHRIERPPNGPLNEHLRLSTGNPCSVTEQNSSTCPDRSQDPINGARREESQANGACSQQESQSSSIEQARKTFSQSNQGCSDPRGNNYSKGRGRRQDGWRPGYRRLRCDPCERTFTSMVYLEAHMSSHVKCGEEGCTFEASGKMIKEHKVVEHGKISAPTTVVGRKALALRSTENEQEIRQWREERKINYPTAANVLRKLEEMEDRKAKGEYFDGAAQKRRQSLRDVLAKQRELGIPVAEIPAHYLSERNRRWQRPNKNNWKREVEERATNDKVTVLVEDTVCESFSQSQDLAGNKRSHPSTDVLEKSPESPDKKHIKCTPVQEEVSSEQQNLGDNGKDTELQQHLVSEQNDANIVHTKKGSFRKAFRKESSRRRRQRKPQCNLDSPSQRKPSLLSKLLESDIQRDRSHLLQCIRFIVNNSFVKEWPTAPLNFFEWVEVEDLYSIDQAIIDKAHSPDLQDFSNEEKALSSFTWEQPTNRDISESFGKIEMGELALHVNDVLTDSDEDGIFKYMNLD